MKNIFTFLFVFFLYSAQATNYYFSAVSGDDSYTPVKATSPATPWKTLSKLNSYFSSLQPGDSVLFKRGETFYGSITVNKSGSALLPIIIGAYGTGNKPVITSLVTLSGWVSKGNGVWESYNFSLGATLNTVLINDALQQIGRYPNSNTANKGYLTLESHSTNTITDNELNSTLSWKGAELVLRSRRWVLDKCPILNHVGSTITYAPVTSYNANDDYGYFIQNDIKTLDKFGEWYYNPLLKKLSIYFGANAPSSYIIQAATIDNVISSTSYNNIFFDNLNVKGANSIGFNIRGGSNIDITNCNVLFPGGTGVYVNGHKGFLIENSTVSYANNNGIDLGYTGDSAVVRNNKVINTSIFAGMGGSGDGKSIGIVSNGNGNLIEYNEIKNTGYIGISFNGNNVTVKNNLVDSFCLTKDDGSGIYTYTGSSNISKFGRKVIGNIIINGIGAPEGINDTKPGAEGIYLDDNSSGVEISNNTVANLPGKGIFLNNARDLIISNNTLYNNEIQFYAHQYRKVAGAAIRNLNMKENVFFSKENDQEAAYFTTEQDDNDEIGELDSNYYARPIDDELVILNSFVNDLGSRVNESLDLFGWKKKYGKDENSKKTAKQIEPYRLMGVIGSNKILNGAFNTNISGIFKTSCTAAWSNAGQLDGGYLQVTPTDDNSSVYLRIGGLTANKKYILKYSVKGSSSGNMAIGMFFRKDASPYTNLTLTQYRKVSTARTDNQMLFYSSADETAATVVFRVDDFIKYYLDNIEVYEADAAITNIDDSLKFEFNPTSVSKTVTLAGNYLDAKNNKYANKLVLEPYTSAVLIKDDRIVNAAPEVSIISPLSNATFDAPASVNISAAASDTDGTISKVDFYVADSLLVTVTESPYIFKWNNVEGGTYTITAKATDNDGLETTSDPVNISVLQNTPPSVVITTPVTNSKYTSLATIRMSAAALDTDGTVTKVEFYNGTNLLRIENDAPYTYTWNNVTAGTYTIIAKATDNEGAVTTSAGVTVTVSQKASLRSAANNTNSIVTTNTFILNVKPEMAGKEVEKMYDLLVFPNPAVDKIQIRLKGLVQSNQKAVLRICNLAGTTVKNFSVVVTGKIIEADIRSLKRGMYTISVVSDEFNISRKFIKN